MTLTFEDARHLLSRTGFGGSPDDIRSLTQLDRVAAVSRVLDGTHRRAVTPPPRWINKLPPSPERRKHLSQGEKQAFREERKEEALELKAWWYQEMMTTPSPLTERMTLFWHNHFTSSLHKVKWPSFLYRQNLLLRAHALGSFRDLLVETAKDPAMIRYLDTGSNHKDHPNENYARELFELFTLGEGHYTEQDVKQAARAFTGWHIDPDTGGFRFNAKQHDDGVKQVFGTSGRFSGEDMLSLTLKSPQVAIHIIRKLWREFVSDEPEAQEVSRLADTFRSSTYQIKPVLSALLMSPAFWAPENRGALIKSPVELLIGTVRLFRLPVQEPIMLIRAGRRLGQDVFDPPNVKGWPGGTRWITSATLLDRWQILARSIRGHEMGTLHNMQASAGGGSRPSMSHNGHGAAWLEDEPDEIIKQTLLPTEPVHPLANGEERWHVVRQLVMDPVYQLK